MFLYTAFGMGIQSKLPLPELPAAVVAEDVMIRLQEPSFETAPQELSRSVWVKLDRDEAHLALPGICEIRVVGGREVILSPEPDARESLVRLYLLGSVMAALLYQRGKLVLHGSCVCIDGEAVAFLGESGWGKSSLAAAFFVNGYPVVADDLAAVEFEAGKVRVSPGFPQLKIRPELLASIGLNARPLFHLDEEEAKLGLDVSQGFPIRSMPLKRIYVLSENTEPEIRPIPPQQAVLQLIRHSYPTRTLHPGDALHLQQCAELARAVPLYWLKPSPDLATLTNLVALLVENPSN